LAESEYTLAVKFDLESIKRVLAETDLISGSLFILRLPNLSVSLLSSPSWTWCLFVIKSELNSVLVASEFELCTKGNSTLHIYLSVRPTPERERESVCGDLLTCIPLFIASVFEVSPEKKEKKEKKGSVLKKRKKKKKQGANSLRLFFSLLFGVVLCDFLCV
jgi:hypothetical protein